MPSQIYNSSKHTTIYPFDVFLKIYRPKYLHLPPLIPSLSFLLPSLSMARADHSCRTPDSSNSKSAPSGRLAMATSPASLSSPHPPIPLPASFFLELSPRAQAVAVVGQYPPATLRPLSIPCVPSFLTVEGVAGPGMNAKLQAGLESRRRMKYGGAAGRHPAGLECAGGWKCVWPG